MDFRNISAWSIRNPIIPIVAFIALTLAGILSFNKMEIQNDPDIEFPVVIVSIAQPGAAPSEIDTQITEKVESAISTVEGIDVITSSVSEGNSQTVVRFEIGQNVDNAVNEVKAAVDQLRGDLPDGIIEPRVFKVSTSSNSFANYAVESDDMTIEQLSWFVDDTVSKRLLAVPGMSSAARRGGVDREIRVVLDPARMQALGVTAAQVNSVLRQNNLDAGGGVAQIAGSRQSVRVLGNADTAYDLGQRQISLGGGRTIKLSDIADVRDGNSEIRTISKVNGKPVVTFAPTRAKGESDVTVYDGAQEVMREIEAENPGIRFVELSNMVRYAKGQYHSSMAAMIEGALLAIVVVFLFLRDWRATIIAAIAIPLAAIPTFFFMDLLGFTLNTMSLLALGLVAGVLVDDAIVEIENIVRHMRMGKSAYQASIDAADEIGLAVVATTFCIVAVFLPVGLMPGIAGQFFKNFGLTVVASVLMSLAVARMITPLIAAYFMKDHGAGDHANGPIMGFYERVLRWTLDNRVAKAMRSKIDDTPMHWWYLLPTAFFFALILAAFVAGLQMTMKVMGDMELPVMLNIFGGIAVGILAGFVVAFVIRAIMGRVAGEYGHWYVNLGDRVRARFRDHRIWVMGVGLGAFVCTIALIASTPVQFFPDSNFDYSSVRVSMVPGTTLEQTQTVAERVETIIKAQQETDNVLLVAGEGDATLYITLREDRDRSSLDYERETALLFRDIPDARINFQANQQGPGGGSGRDISVMLSGSDPALLERTAASVVQEMKGIDLIKAPRVEADLQRPELIITPRADLAASLGVTTVSLSQAIRIATIGEIDQNSAKFSLSDRQVPIRVVLPEASRDKLSTIRNLPVPTASGGSVPLSRVADIRFGSGPTTIQRYDRQRRVYIGADLAPGAEKGRADEAIKELPIMQNLPTGVSNKAEGSDKFLAELINDFAIALVSGILLVFAVLVLLYRRLMSPLVNMGSLLLAPLGGILAIKLLGQPISMPVFIGVLMLFGIVAKNSILLVDFAIEEMARGEGKFVAIVEAGRKRAQPIVMTTVAMTAGMVPTAMSISGDGAWRAPMGTVVIGGLILSTLLTLLIVPAGFSLADGFEKRVGPWLRHKFLTYQPGDENRPLRGPAPSGPEAAPAE
ncbi:AcrB/AcrD/AcrF family protein [Altererythrobacter confluentis]|uniref:AcrB/AcrD/AcrF family protein n=1 Tax=Allopontixanthobacter confluentis TaxID=1849021 RepID=A0A6L7GGU2_9SPHN|nr:efflux RND transporter permease subunit [Allopontixanthobacter confluentis]MXP15127.1 AcrB/AcrD/AcrF family protein [Allopontixanthobacter confluentis]